MKISGNRIADYRKAKDWSLQRLADACQTSKSQIDKLEKGQRRLTVEWMVRLAKPLGCDPRDLLPQQPYPSPALQGGLRPPIPVPEETIPVLQLDFGGDAQKAVVSEKEIDRTPKPPFLAHTQKAYAFYVTNNAMAPMFRTGQILYVNPNKPPTSGAGVVVIMKNGGALLKAFIERADSFVRLREYGPEEHEVLVVESEIGEIHAVVGMKEP